MRGSGRQGLWIAMAIGGLSSTAWAASGPGDEDRVLPCRPTIACTADIVTPGVLEVEGGFIYRRDRVGNEQRTFPFLIKLTAADWVQVQVGSNGYTVNRGDPAARYFDDVALGLKFHLADQGAILPSISVSATLNVPTVGGQLGYVRTYDALFTGYASKDFGPIHADLNASFNLWRIEAAPIPQGEIALSFSTDLPPPFGLMAEVYAFSSAAPVSPRDGGFLFALTHSPRKWLMFDLGGDVGFFRATRTYSAFLGVTVIPVVLWRPKK